MKKSESFITKLLNFLKDESWNYILLSQFYRCERKNLEQEYKLKEDAYFAEYKNKKADFYAEFLSDDIIKGFITILDIDRKKLGYDGSYDEKRFYEWLCKNKEYQTVAEAFGKGYLWEWLAIYDKEPYMLSTAFGQIDNSQYAKWNNEFVLRNYDSRRKFDNRYHAQHTLFLLYRGIEKEWLFRTMFSGMNGGDLERYNDTLIEMLARADLLSEMQQIYEEHWNLYGKRHNWQKGLLELCTSIKERTEDYPDVTKDRIDYLRETVKVKTPGQSRVEKKVDREKLYHVLYCLSRKHFPNYNSPVSKHFWRHVFDTLKEMNMLPKVKPSDNVKRTAFVYNVVGYVYPDASHEKLRSFSDELGKVDKTVKKLKGKEKKELDGLLETFRIELAKCLVSFEQISAF